MVFIRSFAQTYNEPFHNSIILSTECGEKKHELKSIDLNNFSLFGSFAIGNNFIYRKWGENSFFWGGGRGRRGWCVSKSLSHLFFICINRHGIVLKVSKYLTQKVHCAVVFGWRFGWNLRYPDRPMILNKWFWTKVQASFDQIRY